MCVDFSHNERFLQISLSLTPRTKSHMKRKAPALQCAYIPLPLQNKLGGLLEDGRVHVGLQICIEALCLRGHFADLIPTLTFVSSSPTLLSIATLMM